MSVDHTRVIFHSGFGAYRNLGVYETTVDVDTTVVAPGTVRTWSRTVTVDPGSTFSTISFQANEFNGGGSATALKWQTYPSSDIIYINMTTDPGGNGNFGTSFVVRINDNQVTFEISVLNPYVSNIALSNTSIGVRYAIHTIE